MKIEAKLYKGIHWSFNKGIYYKSLRSKGITIRSKVFYISLPFIRIIVTFIAVVKTHSLTKIANTYLKKIGYKGKVRIQARQEYSNSIRQKIPEKIIRKLKKEFKKERRNEKKLST